MSESGGWCVLILLWYGAAGVQGVGPSPPGRDRPLPGRCHVPGGRARHLLIWFGAGMIGRMEPHNRQIVRTVKMTDVPPHHRKRLDRATCAIIAPSVRSACDRSEWWSCLTIVSEDNDDSAKKEVYDLHPFGQGNVKHFARVV